MVRAICLRFIPKLTFTWNGFAGNSNTPESVAAFYRLDYGPDVGFAKVRESDWALPGYIRSGSQEIQTTEELFNAVDNGNAGMLDNIHTAHINQDITIPGCRPTHFDCVHKHWRWGDILLTWYGQLDPQTEPSNDANLANIVSRGTPYLVPGQTINIAITKLNPSEELDPNNPSMFVNNHESLATASNGTLTSATHPVVWYMATANDKNTDTFFRHGFFVLDR